ncbi:hypothetical protein Agub_g3894 [Astrephomene gubernaculifera]|uniref:Glycosyl transferase CAP10 domain-containing protein n=1 Tax=Astrephomene gubernaculifera TaxID=47775 RepID=A0AAD3DJA6_9CHLO|nr:hypothetical protein Agub_g3894 [Astrephomene gubernaculifera]
MRRKRPSSRMALRLISLLAVLASLLLARRCRSDALSTPNSSIVPHHHACHLSLLVDENPEPQGNPGMLPCVSSDAELQDLYNETMDLDFANWKDYVPLNRTHIDKFMDRWKGYGWHQQSMILIKDNKWYFPFHYHWNHTQKTPDHYEDGITLWVTATQYYFQRFASEIQFPDAFFFLSDQDSGWCQSMFDCPIPAMSIAKRGPDKLDLLFPFMVTSDLPLYNFPFQLKHDRAFFVGRPNWGGSPKTFMVNGKPEMFFGRKHLANLSMSCPEEVYCALLGDPNLVPGARWVTEETPLREHARWRYVMNLDGVTYAGRLARLMHTDSVILKEQSEWVEYYYRALKEGTHYLSIFKNGPNDVLDVVRQWRDRPRDLQHIAFNSQAFAKRYLCPKARMLYFKRMLERYMEMFNGHDGRNAMKDFVNEVLMPIIEARKNGDMSKTYFDMKPYKP